MFNPIIDVYHAKICLSNSAIVPDSEIKNSILSWLIRYFARL